MISLIHRQLMNCFIMLHSLQLFQKSIKTAAFEGKDTLIVQLTGSGKTFFFFHLFI